jgi:hypothetical protein
VDHDPLVAYLGGQHPFGFSVLLFGEFVLYCFFKRDIDRAFFLVYAHLQGVVHCTDLEFVADLFLGVEDCDGFLLEDVFEG